MPKDFMQFSQDTFADEKAEFLDEYKDGQNFLMDSAKKRCKSDEETEAFEALLGMNKKHTSFMPASDQKLSYNAGLQLMKEARDLFHLVSSSPFKQAWFPTFISQSFTYDPYDMTVEVHKLRDKIQSALHSLAGPKVNGLFIIEMQMVRGNPNSKGSREYCLHVHGLCWGPSGIDLQTILNRSTGFKSNLTKKPIYVENVTETEQSFLNIATYMMKPSVNGKSVNQKRYDEGKSCLRTIKAKDMKPIDHFRTLEFRSKVPLEALIFSVRGGSEIRNRVVAEMHRYQATRASECLELPMTVEALFENIYASNKRLRNYTPMVVNHIRPDKLKKASSKV